MATMDNTTGRSMTRLELSPPMMFFSAGIAKMEKL